MGLTKKMRSILYTKLKKFNNEWVGCLTPVEFIYLIENGCKVNEFSKYRIPYDRERIKKGRMSTSWYYFSHVPKEFYNKK